MNQLIALPNPFRNTVATDPWQPAFADVPEIHARAFERCCQALNYVRSQGKTASILIMGEAGSGKTHLLARLHAYLASSSQSPGQAGGAFIYVLLQTSPHLMWRYLRRHLVDDLLHPMNGSSQFEQIMLYRLAECYPAEAQVLLQRMRQEARNHNWPARELELIFDRVERQTQVQFDINFCTIIGHLLLKQHVREARAWLRGDDLPEATLNRLGVGAGDEDEMGQEDKARQTVLALSRLAGPQFPLVFCFDQVEALQLDPQDQAGLFAFGQLITALFNQTSNALLISCIQSQFLEVLRRAIPDMAWDRLVSFGQDTLLLLTREEAQALVKARMDAYPELARLRTTQSDQLWPLQEADLNEALSPHGRTTPRRLLSFCAEKFEQRRRGIELPPPPIEDFLKDALEERIEQLEQIITSYSAEQTGEIIEDGLPRLIHLTDRRWKQLTKNLPRDVNLVFESSEASVCLSLCNHTNMTSLAARLRRLLMQSHLLPQLVLLRDERLPISAAAKVTRQRLAEIINQGGRLVRPSAETLAALGALRKLLAEASAGDLANCGEAVELQTVQQWLAANLPMSLRDLLEDVLPEARTSTQSEADFDLAEDIAELLQNHHLVSLEDAAARLEREPRVVEECARRHSERFGLLDGPPAVLFQLVSESIETGS